MAYLLLDALLLKEASEIRPIREHATAAAFGASFKASTPFGLR